MYPISNRITHGGQNICCKESSDVKTRKRGIVSEDLYRILGGVGEERKRESFSFLSDGLFAPDGICHPEEF